MQGLYFDELSIGQAAEMSRVVGAADIEAFAEVSGDNNPVHLDEAYAKTTTFGERIAHGMLSAGYISAVFGTRLPGPGAIYVSQTLNFRGPVKIGDTVTAHVRVKELVAAKKRAVFECRCTVGDTCVLEGEAVLMVPARAKV